MKIAIDIDDVLGEFFAGFKEYYKNHFDEDLPETLFNSNEFKNNPYRLIIIDRIKQFLHSPEILTIKLVDGSKEGIKKLASDHELHIVTGRPLTAMDDTKEWLSNNFPIVFKSINSTDYHIVNGGARTKGTICRDLKVDLLVDDFYRYTKECAEYGIHSILFTHPWNEDKPENDYIKRANNWQEIIKKIYGKI